MTTTLKIRNLLVNSKIIILDDIHISSLSRSHRSFVTASKPLRKENTDEKVEQTCQEVTEAADEVKEGFTEVSNMTKEVKGKLSEAKGSLVKRARENVVDIAAQKAKEQVIKKVK
uniref:uncharacterized protein LOC122583479 n=1 Tax=Erigeron canadensis TaxID=72917 RepID=UPI001CB9335F|nr:uncharacterized protein LOC122583479 [Erigeron canadensis]